MEHEFTAVLMRILADEFGEQAADIFRASPVLQYLNVKTRSASRGSKSRAAFANHYALYVLVEDYVKKEYHVSGGYEEYEGARFSDLFRRQRELPFGGKLQNHALNHRLNEEFRKYFPACENLPILRDPENNRYWINENLLLVETGGRTFNIAPAILAVVDAYLEAKRGAFQGFISDCERMQSLEQREPDEIREFIASLLRPEVDARLFEIVSYGILKAFYGGQVVFWGWRLEDIHEEYLVLYKTGRTNAVDGGIDFVMKPLGRFFQVTETVDVRKYFLDIDKVQRYPMTFVVKSTASTEAIIAAIAEQARRVYRVARIVERYMSCIEEIINIPGLLERFDSVVNDGKLGEVIREIVIQSKVEFGYEEV